MQPKIDLVSYILSHKNASGDKITVLGPLIMLAVSSGKHNVTVCRPSVCLSSLFL